MAKNNKKRRTPEAVENNLINLAMVEAEKRIKEGTATSQLLTHFVKRGSRREKLEESLIEEKKKAMAAKVESLEIAKKTESLFEEAIEAFKTYSGG